MAQLRRVFQRFGRVQRGQGRQADLAARRQHPADRLVRRADGVLHARQFQLHIDRGEQIVAHHEGFAAGMLAGFQLHLGVELLDHSITEGEHARTRCSLVAVGDHAVGVGVLVDGEGRGRHGQPEQPKSKNGAPQHNGRLHVVMCQSAAD